MQAGSKSESHIYAPSVLLHVSNISDKVDDAALDALFRPFGAVVSIKRFT